jgi:hypothetical protein
MVCPAARDRGAVAQVTLGLHRGGGPAVGGKLVHVSLIREPLAGERP